MKPLIACCFLLATAAATTGQLPKTERVLNLSGIHCESVYANGNRLFLSVTGQPPAFDALVRPQPTPLKRRDPTNRQPMIEVLFGRDVLGYARFFIATHDAILTSPTTNASKLKLTTVSLIFDTSEQAERAAAVLRLPDVTPSPLKRRRGDR